MTDGFLIGNPIARQIIAALDVLDATLCFAKMHRPEEQQKVADAQHTLACIRGQYPTTYAMTLRKLGRMRARKQTQS